MHLDAKTAKSVKMHWKIDVFLISRVSGFYTLVPQEYIYIYIYICAPGMCVEVFSLHSNCIQMVSCVVDGATATKEEEKK